MVLKNSFCTKLKLKISCINPFGLYVPALIRRGMTGYMVFFSSALLLQVFHYTLNNKKKLTVVVLTIENGKGLCIRVCFFFFLLAKLGTTKKLLGWVE